MHITLIVHIKIFKYINARKYPQLCTAAGHTCGDQQAPKLFLKSDTLFSN